MASSRRDTRQSTGLVPALLLCVAGALAIVFASARAPLAPRALPAIALSHGVVLSLIPGTPAAPPTAKSAAVHRDSTARLAGDTPEARAPGATARASGPPPPATFDAACTADSHVTAWIPALRGSRRSAAAPQSRSSARRTGARPASIERDVHAPRGPPSHLTA